MSMATWRRYREAIAAQPQPTPTPSRQSELEAMDWRDLKELCIKLGISTNKPAGFTWQEYAIPLILETEQ